MGQKPQTAIEAVAMRLTTEAIQEAIADRDRGDLDRPPD
jgi:hypothetical protein